MTTQKPLSAMEQLLAKHPVQVPDRGEKVTGHVTHVSKRGVYIDLGALGIGVIRGTDLVELLEYGDAPEVGSELSGYVLDFENELGVLELSLRHLNKAMIWQELTQLKNKGEIVPVKVVNANKGGLMTNVYGIMAFLPVSQLASEHYPRVEGGDKGLILEQLQKLVGKKLKVKVINVDRDEDKLILSEKAVSEKEHLAEIAKYKIGQVLDGVISGIVDFGVFVKFGENLQLEGLVHLSELSWQRVEDPSDLVHMGQKVQIELIGVDGTRISLSMKRLKDDPWKKAAAKYKIGQVVPGEITKMSPFGAFVQLDKEIHGLAHISELKAVDGTPLDIQIGEKRDFKIISIEATEHRLGLTLNLEKDVKASESAAADAKVAEAKAEMKKAAKQAKK